ncbi:alanyl-tRNA editing protein [Bacillus kwashiorkori]|uniref:alanyl-tRNA editing protein n=1 Tax=Bacillus kwashiorkori TaxID=1522318 RepID=UPI0007824BCD|nr:alanyl-tRNA editing protein [Bacillus kwashiorkori]
MTELLYYTSPLTYEWKTEITSISQQNNHYHITLAASAFYPTGGGQPCDLGKINGIDVLDVFIENGEVIHVLSAKPVNLSAYCEIDKNRRIEHTQHHSGQHLLSAIFLQLLGANTVSFHLSNDSATIDLDIESVANGDIKKVETYVNQEIYNNKKINVFYISKSEAADYPLRKYPENIDPLRIVEIEGIEYNACAGTHVESTGQIGLLKIMKTEKQRGLIRVHFTCGIRALKDYREKQNILTNIVKQLTTSEQQLEYNIEKMIIEQKERNKKYQVLFEKYAHLLTEQLMQQQGPIIIFVDEFPVKDLNYLASIINNKTDKPILLGSVSDLRVIFTHNSNNSFHCGKFIQEHVQPYSGKGGGSNNKAQAIFQNRHDLLSFIEFVKDEFVNM